MGNTYRGSEIICRFVLEVRVGLSGSGVFSSFQALSSAIMIIV